MPKPLFAAVDILFGKNLEPTGFLKYSNSTHMLLADIPMSQGGSTQLDDGSAAGNLRGKSLSSNQQQPDAKPSNIFLALEKAAWMEAPCLTICA